ncbi:MAG: hypothetical protein K2W92_08175 [Alphaproteobacteria bacterium]|nr:hypothetical protein [Alphaproteobacteria bacterium]
MRIFLFSAFASLLFFIPPLQAVKGLSENGEILDLSNICITAQKGVKSRSPGGWKKPGRSVDEIVEEYIDPHKEQLSKVQVIDLSSNNLTDDILNLFVTSLQQKNVWELLKSVRLVCLENNSFTAEVAPTLTQLLNLNSEEKEDNPFPYISILDTPIALSNVNKLARKLKGIDHQAPALMSHLVFMKQSYVWHAENRVQAYHTMMKSYELPSSWASIQKAYYKSAPYRDLIAYRNQQEHKSWVNFVSQSLERHSPLREEPSVIIDSATQLDTSEIEKLAEFVGNLSLKGYSPLSPPVSVE